MDENLNDIWAQALADSQADLDAAADQLIYMSIFAGIVGIFLIVSLWKIFTKAGKPGWACLIPIYNLVVLLEIVKKPVWWVILLLIPIVNFVILIILYIELAKAFGQGTGFGLGIIFLSIIFIPLLAFGKKYQYVYDERNEISEIGS